MYFSDAVEGYEHRRRKRGGGQGGRGEQWVQPASQARVRLRVLMALSLAQVWAGPPRWPEVPALGSQVPAVRVARVVRVVVQAATRS